MDYEGKVSRLAEAAAVEVHRRAVRKLGEALAEVLGSRPPGMMSAFPVYLRVDEIEALHAHATESKSIASAARLEPHEAQMLLDLALQTLNGVDPAPQDAVILDKLEDIAKGTEYQSNDLPGLFAYLDGNRLDRDRRVLIAASGECEALIEVHSGCLPGIAKAIAALNGEPAITAMLEAGKLEIIGEDEPPEETEHQSVSQVPAWIMRVLADTKTDAELEIQAFADAGDYTSASSQQECVRGIQAAIDNLTSEASAIDPALECKSITADLSALSDEIDILESDDHPCYINEAAAKMREIAARLAREMALYRAKTTECRSVHRMDAAVAEEIRSFMAAQPHDPTLDRWIDALSADGKRGD